MQNYSADVAIIARCDKQIKELGLKKISLSTEYGDIDRVFVGDFKSTKIAVIYGRFDSIRGTSVDINFEKPQAAINAL